MHLSRRTPEDGAGPSDAGAGADQRPSGLAHDLRDTTGRTGTYRYMAPEVLGGANGAGRLAAGARECCAAALGRWGLIRLRWAPGPALVEGRSHGPTEPGRPLAVRAWGPAACRAHQHGREAARHAASRSDGGPPVYVRDVQCNGGRASAGRPLVAGRTIAHAPLRERVRDTRRCTCR